MPRRCTQASVQALICQMSASGTPICLPITINGSGTAYCLTQSQRRSGESMNASISL